jgi:hypothetical protein
MLFDFSFKDSKRTEIRQKIKEWVAACLSDSSQIQVLVTELECAEPGCPPKETVIALIYPNAVPRQFKIFKAIVDVTEADVSAALAAEKASAEAVHSQINNNQSKCGDRK